MEYNKFSYLAAVIFFKAYRLQLQPFKINKARGALGWFKMKCQKILNSNFLYRLPKRMKFPRII